jgi:antitoxin ParD1/3/4
MPNAKKSFVIGERYAAFIDKQVASGRFNNASEVVRAGLRLLEDEEAKLEQLRALIAEGDADTALAASSKLMTSKRSREA